MVVSSQNAENNKFTKPGASFLQRVRKDFGVGTRGEGLPRP